MFGPDPAPDTELQFRLRVLVGRITPAERIAIGTDPRTGVGIGRHAIVGGQGVGLSFDEVGVAADQVGHGVGGRVG